MSGRGTELASCRWAGGLFSTYLSGSGGETVADLAVDKQGNAYLVGNTSSASFPFNREAPEDDTPSEYRSFVLKFSPAGEIIYAKPLSSALGPTAVAADHDGAAYIGGVSSGDVDPIGGLGFERDAAPLLRSEDGGQSWEFRSDGLADADFAYGGQLLAARRGGDVRLYTLDQRSLYRSDDRGESWKRLSPPQASEYLYFTDLAVETTQPERVFATYGCALHASSDGGETWERVLAYEPAERCVSSVTLAAGQPGAVYAGSSSGGQGSGPPVWIHRSEDGGQSWSDIPIPQGENLSHVLDLAVDPADTDIAYASFLAETSTPGVTQGSFLLFRTDNAGQSWQRIFTGARAAPLIDPAEPQALFLVSPFPQGNNLVYRSFNRGETWTSSEVEEPPGSGSELQNLALDRDRLYATNAKGLLFVSADRGSTWSRSAGPPVPAYQVVADPGGTGTLYILGSGAQAQGFLLKLNPDASAAEYLTLLGGSGYDHVEDLAIDEDGRVYATGTTTSPDFPSTSQPVSNRTGFDNDAFLTVIGPRGDQIEFSTWIGGSGRESLSRIALGTDGGVVLAGFTDSGDFPLQNPIEAEPSKDGSDWIAAFQPQQDRVTFAGYLIANDTFGPLALAADTEGFIYAGGRGSFLDPNGVSRDRDFLMRIDAGGNVTNADSIAVKLLAVRSSGSVVTAVDGASGIWNFAASLYDTPAIAVSVIDYNNVDDTATPHLRAIINAADQRGHPLTPGTVVSIYGAHLGPPTPVAGEPDDGRFPAALAGVRVLFGEQPAALLYVSERQINAVTPPELGDHPLISVRVERDGVASNLFGLTTSPAAPAIFSMQSGNESAALAINADGTLNSPGNPAAPGSRVSVFATGVGAFSPSFAAGEVTPLEPPFPAAADVTSIGFQSYRAQITYAGAAPGVVGGVAQINFVVPPDFSAGNYYLDLEAGEGRRSGPVRFAVGP